jgi:anthranilate synthase component 1
VKLAAAGQAGLVTRRLSGIHDPVELLAKLGAPLLFRRTNGRSLILVDSAMRLEARQGEVRLTAASEGGAAMLARMADDFTGRVVDRVERELTLRFERCDVPDETVRERAPTALTALRRLVSCLAPLDLDEPFAVAALGLVGFDHVDIFEELPERPDGEFPDLIFHLAETLVVVEPGGAARVLAMAVGSDDPAEAHRQHFLAAERLQRAVERCGAKIAAAAPALVEKAEATSDLDDIQFAEIVTRLKEHIAAGDIFQAVPSRTFRAPCPDPHAAFRRLVAADPSAYQFMFDSGHGTLFGASPETAVEIRREASRHILSVSPIAGTRKRGATADEDSRNEAELRLDAKEVAEHMMLVDLARNDVARVSRTGTRTVPRLLEVERFSKVMHLVSTVEGELAEGKDFIDAIRACLNVGTLSGAPKLKAIELIRAFERSARGPYGGAIGWIAGDGTMDSAVVIRSALVRDAVAQVRAGAGVVADSDPLAEAAETRAMAGAVLAALGVAA